jgi:hypothetical protein
MSCCATRCQCTRIHTQIHSQTHAHTARVQTKHVALMCKCLKQTVALPQTYSQLYTHTYTHKHTHTHTCVCVHGQASMYAWCMYVCIRVCVCVCVCPKISDSLKKGRQQPPITDNHLIPASPSPTHINFSGGVL